MTSSSYLNRDKELSFSEGSQEIRLFFGTKIYERKEENVLTRFHSAYFLLLEQRHSDQRYNERVDLE